MVRYKRNHVEGTPRCDKDPIVDRNGDVLIRNDGSVIEFRGLLEIELKKDYENAQKNVLVVMMNPSKADSEVSDGTINKLIKFLVEGYVTHDSSYYEIIDGIKHLNVFNILPIYNPNNDLLFNDFEIIISERGIEYLESLLEENIQRIKEALQSEFTDYIVLAWGGFRMDFHLRCITI